MKNPLDVALFLLNENPQPMWIFRIADLQIVNVNQAAIDLYRYSKQEFLAKTIHDLRSAEYPLEKDFEKIVNNHQINRKDVMHQDAEGKLLAVHIVTYPLIYHEEECRLVIVNNLQQIIDLKNKITSVELESSVNRNRYDIILNSTADIVWDWNLSDDSVSWNASFYAELGYPNDKSVNSGAFWKSKIHPEDRDRVFESIQAVIASKQNTWSNEYRFLTQDGSYKYFIDRGVLLYDGFNNVYRMIGTMHDVTQVTNYINKIETQNKQLRRIAFLQSHVVRAPLSRILGAVNLIEENILNEEEKVMFMKSIVDSSKELDQVIHEIIELTDSVDISKDALTS